MPVRNAANKRSSWRGRKRAPSAFYISLSAKDHFTGSKFCSQASIYGTGLRALGTGT